MFGVHLSVSNQLKQNLKNPKLLKSEIYGQAMNNLRL